MKTMVFILFTLMGIALSHAQIAQVMISAEKGDIDAQKFLADSYAKGINGLRKNDIQAFVWTKAVAEQGDAEYEYILSQMYWKGIGTSQDTVEMLNWMSKAASHGYPPAMENLAYLCYNSGDYEEAIPLLKGALNKGYTVANYLLGMAYINGNGVERNDKKGIEHLQAAIEVRIIPAYKELAYCYANGHGVKQDFKEAHRLIDIAHNHQPDNLELYDAKGTFFLIEKRFEMAKKVWEKLLSKERLYPEKYHTMFTAAMTNSIDYNIPEVNVENKETIALVIANEHYRRVSPVIYANSDGQMICKYFTSALGIPENNIIYVEDATLADMKYNIDAIKKVANEKGEGCTILFYYAGHGIPDIKEQNAFLLPIDSYGTDSSTGYSLDDIYKSFSEINAKVIIVLDACFSGAKREGDMLVAARGVAIKAKETKPKGNIIVFSAAQGDETAYPLDKQKHGLFTYYFLRKLQESKGNATLGEIADYVKQEVRQKSQEIKGKPQTPAISVSPMMESVWRNLKLR